MINRTPLHGRNLLLALIVCLSIFTACASTPPPFEHEVQVKAVEDGEAIANADVRAEIGVRNIYEATTNSDGVARLTIEADHLDGWAKVIVEADNYQRRSVLVQLTEESLPTVVGLEPLSTTQTP